MITVLDIETTFTKDGDPTPFHPENKLVSVGINDQYFFFYHKDMKDMKKIQENKQAVQDLLDKSVLVNCEKSATRILPIFFHFLGSL